MDEPIRDPKHRKPPNCIQKWKKHLSYALRENNPTLFPTKILPLTNNMSPKVFSPIHLAIPVPLRRGPMASIVGIAATAPEPQLGKDELEKSSQKRRIVQ